MPPTIRRMSIAPLIRRLAPQYGIDPAAAIAVALGEGGLVNRQGDVGDLAGGGSYGPFQLYTKGALPAQFRGKPQVADQWAWSPEGIKYALGRMRAAGAGGLRGNAAVEAIIRKFERPADPNKSVRLALSRLGTLPQGGVAQSAEQGPSFSGTPTFGSKPTVAGSMPAASTNRRDFILQGLIGGRDPNALIQALPGMRESASPVVVPRVATGTPTPGLPPRPGTPQPSRTAAGIRELIYDPVGSVFDGTASNKPYGGHGNHLHFAGKNPEQMLKAISLAQQLGLSVRENPYTDPVDPVHTKNSWHYGKFPGKYNGRQLGQAADISGNAKALKQLYARLASL